MPQERPLPHDLTLAEFVRFRDYINEHGGIFLEEGKLDSLRISLLTRATRLRAPSLDVYYSILTTDEVEFKELMSLITINETSFFRFPEQFEALALSVMPEIAESKREGARSLRIWSAGCSTGEEPYSVAMTLADSGYEGLGWRLQVFGSDVSTRALSVAQKGRYPAKALKDLPPDKIARHFERTGDGYRVSGGLRRLVAFGYHNLIKEPYPAILMGDWDVVFCRNVTIYFQLESTRRVIENLYRSLNPGGYLFLGHSETLANINDRFEPVEVDGVFLYRKPQVVRSQWWVAESSPSAGGSPSGRARTRSPMPTARGTGALRTEPRAAAALTRREKPAVAQRATLPLADALKVARVASAEGDPARVLTSVETLLAADDGVAEAYLLAAHAHADLGDYARAEAECDRALGLDPLMPAARYILGIIHQRRGDTARAESEFKKTVYIDPEFALAHLNLGNIYKAQHRWEAARREYQNALRALYKNPGGEWAHFLGGFKVDLLVKTCERSLLECERASGPG